MKARLPGSLIVLIVVAGCALYTDVTVSPLIYDPTNIDRGSDLPSMVRKADFNHAVSLAADIESKPRKSAQELGSLGEAELAAGRYALCHHIAVKQQPQNFVFAPAAPERDCVQRRD